MKVCYEKLNAQASSGSEVITILFKLCAKIKLARRRPIGIASLVSSYIRISNVAGGWPARGRACAAQSHRSSSSIMTLTLTRPSAGILKVFSSQFRIAGGGRVCAACTVIKLHRRRHSWLRLDKIAWGSSCDLRRRRSLLLARHRNGINQKSNVPA